ncbi:hypothetical protein CONLIGDRAFT_105740 [Coniochaeta ligniaria NRRL 30616]|uniref:Uncharacterized protein n=1 Tax=Coniochaeta ligniaria NRRL 30616 TaxID=1408157 RepID=A0A1J7JB14_9PEZI|nr:hypothetical protein CONLIGDRAFT_105740 [Coniochaeta ligniaria NRRL 30616]
MLPELHTHRNSCICVRAGMAGVWCGREQNLRRRTRTREESIVVPSSRWIPGIALQRRDDSRVPLRRKVPKTARRQGRQARIRMLGSGLRVAPSQDALTRDGPRDGRNAGTLVPPSVPLASSAPHQSHLCGLMPRRTWQSILEPPILGKVRCIGIFPMGFAVCSAARRSLRLACCASMHNGNNHISASRFKLPKFQPVKAAEADSLMPPGSRSI